MNYEQAKKLKLGQEVLWIGPDGMEVKGAVSHINRDCITIMWDHGESSCKHAHGLSDIHLMGRKDISDSR